MAHGTCVLVSRVGEEGVWIALAHSSSARAVDAEEAGFSLCCVATHPGDRDCTNTEAPCDNWRSVSQVVLEHLEDWEDLRPFSFRVLIGDFTLCFYLAFA